MAQGRRTQQTPFFKHASLSILRELREADLSDRLSVFQKICKASQCSEQQLDELFAEFIFCIFTSDTHAYCADLNLVNLTHLLVLFPKASVLLKDHLLSRIKIAALRTFSAPGTPVVLSAVYSLMPLLPEDRRIPALNTIIDSYERIAAGKRRPPRNFCVGGLTHIPEDYFKNYAESVVPELKNYRKQLIMLRQNDFVQETVARLLILMNIHINRIRLSSIQQIDEDINIEGIFEAYHKTFHLINSNPDYHQHIIPLQAAHGLLKNLIESAEHQGKLEQKEEYDVLQTDFDVAVRQNPFIFWFVPEKTKSTPAAEKDNYHKLRHCVIS